MLSAGSIYLTKHRICFRSTKKGQKTTV
ncbi:GRAM domain-containing protein [Alistipes finegoldii]